MIDLYCRLADGGGGRGDVLHHVKRGICPGGGNIRRNMSGAVRIAHMQMLCILHGLFKHYNNALHSDVQKYGDNARDIYIYIYIYIYIV